MKVFLTFLFLFISQILYAQKVEDAYTIDVYARGYCTTCGFAIQIQRSPDLIKIVYAVNDSLSNIRLIENKEYAVISDQFLAAAEKQKTDKALLNSIANQLDSIRITTFSKDSLVFKPSKNIHYTKLLNKIYTASTEQLENNEANKNLILLDGTSFKIKMHSASRRRIIYVNSPRKDRYPWINELIEKTLHLYREEKQNAFLDKGKTNGY